MRIIAGKHKGLILKEFDIFSTRPTADIVKGAIFNVLGQKVINSKFLDLFAGTGAVGFEALSRGAKYCCFVDQNKDSVKLIKDNSKKFESEDFKILNDNFFDVLKQIRANNEKFDIIFLDPPYITDFAEKSLDFIFKNKLLNEFGVVVWEHDKNKLDYIMLNYPNAKTKKYGIKFVTFIE